MNVNCFHACQGQPAQVFPRCFVSAQESVYVIYYIVLNTVWEICGPDVLLWWQLYHKTTCYVGIIWVKDRFSFEDVKVYRIVDRQQEFTYTAWQLYIIWQVCQTDLSSLITFNPSIWYLLDKLSVAGQQFFPVAKDHGHLCIIHSSRLWHWPVENLQMQDKEVCSERPDRYLTR